LRASGGKSEPEQCGGIALALRGGHNALCEQGKCRRWPACIAVEVRRWQSPQFLPRHSRSHRRAECVRTFDLVGEGYCPPIIIKHKNADGLRVMSYLKARLSVRWPSIREHRLAKGGWVSENAEALLCKTSRRFGDLCCFPSMTCPTRAFCTGRTSEIQLFSWSPSSYLSQPGCGYWLYWTPLLLRLLVEQRGSAPCLVWQSSFKFKQGSERLSRSAMPKGRLRWRLGL
jgi:hypothetical protein